MHQKFMTIMLLVLLAGCVQPRVDQPKANGAYLVIDGERAWAVLVSDGKRSEESGRVLEAIRLPGRHSLVAASYVIETANCGTLQWVTERQDNDDGSTRLMSLYAGQQLEAPECVLAQGLGRTWAALDYSI